MLAATEGGNCYTFAEIRTALHLVGFERVALVQDGERMDGMVGIPGVSLYCFKQEVNFGKLP